MLWLMLANASGLVAYLAGPLLTFGHGSRPAPVLLAGDDRLPLHHELRVAVELHDVARPVRRALARRVPVVRGAWRLAVHHCKGRQRRVRLARPPPTGPIAAS